MKTAVLCDSVLIASYTLLTVLCIACCVKQHTAKAVFVGVKSFLIHCIVFSFFRIAHFALCLVYGYNTYTIGVLPIYNYGSFGPFILDITSNVVFFLTMLVYINLTLHSINVVPFIGVMNEKVDISRRWLIVLAASTVVCLSLVAVYELRLLSLQWFVFISSVLFSIMEAFIIVYWVRFYRILCVIIQKTTIPVELKRKQVGRLFLRLCVFVGSQGIRIVLQLLCSFCPFFTLGSLISVAVYLVFTEVVPGAVALAEQYKTMTTSERYESCFSDLLTSLQDVVSV